MLQPWCSSRDRLKIKIFALYEFSSDRYILEIMNNMDIILAYYKFQAFSDGDIQCI